MSLLCTCGRIQGAHYADDPIHWAGAPPAAKPECGCNIPTAKPGFWHADSCPLYTPKPMNPTNQCDGCRRRLEVRENEFARVHYRGEFPVMACTADRYPPAPKPEAALKALARTTAENVWVWTRTALYGEDREADINMIAEKILLALTHNRRSE